MSSAVPPYVAPPLPPRKRPSSFWPWLMGLTALGVLGLGFLFVVAVVVAASQPSVAIIEVSGPITDEGVSGLIGGPVGGGRNFVSEIEDARRDKSIKAVVIRINSPGGSASASQEMFQAVRRLQGEKPVIASMGDVAASGGYYIAAGCDKIYANASTITGSIGVITQLLNYQELFDKVGLDTSTFKSGRFKDAGSPNRPLTPAERQLFQSMVTSIYQEFVNDVVAGRKTATEGKLTRQKLLPLADGRVYTGAQAKQNLLVDEVGGLYEAINEAGRRAGIKGTPIVRNLSSSGGLGSTLGTSFEGVAQNVGASFARGLVGEIKAESQTVPVPLAR